MYVFTICSILIQGSLKINRNPKISVILLFCVTLWVLTLLQNAEICEVCCFYLFPVLLYCLYLFAQQKGFYMRMDVSYPNT